MVDTDIIPNTTARGGRSPTIETIVLILGFFLVQFPLSVLGLTGLFALSPTFFVTPWTLVTSVYSHAGPVHLLSNLMVLVMVGLLVERTTTRLRYHLFFVATGAIAGLVQVFLFPVTGTAGVLGASGAIFALMGYLITGNVASGKLLDKVDDVAGTEWASTGILLVVGVVIAAFFSGPNTADIAHFTGLFLGLIAGKAKLLHVKSKDETTLDFDDGDGGVSIPVDDE